MSDFPFVSATSANAIISELRPTILSSSALGHVNAILDEVLVSIVEASDSLNPADLRTKGFPAVFAETASEHATVGALGRAAIGEAEVEIRSWYEAHPSARDGFRGFSPRGHGRGLTEEAERKKTPFPLAEAIELMRLKTSSFSTFAPEATPPQQDVDSTFGLWQQAGGDISQETVSPAALWLTAVLEHICEHILSKLTQVLGRDCISTTADTADLYTAICEDDSVYALFKRLKARTKLEQEARGMEGPKRPFRSTSGPSPTVEPSVPLDGSFASLPAANREEYRLHRKYGSTGAPAANRPASEQFTRVPLATNGKPPPVPSSGGQHKRASSVLSLSARQIIGAWQQGQDETDKSSKRLSVDQAEDDFDALIRSGETMRVSLTPSRLSTFDPSFTTARRDKRNSAATSDYISAVQSSSESSLLSSNSTQASTAESGMVTGAAPRVGAGRSLSAATAKSGTHRRSTIEENEEEGTSAQPAIETLAAEPQVYGESSAATGSSSGSGSGSGGTQVDTPTPRGSLLRLPATAVASEPSSSPHASPGAVHDSPRAASEGADDNAGQQTVRLRAKPASVRDRGNMGDLADFLKNTQPVEYIKGKAPADPAPEASSSSSSSTPKVQVNSTPMDHLPIENIAVKKKGPRFKSIMSRMSVGAQKKDKKEDDPSLKAWAEKTLVPSPSNQTLKSHGLNGSDKSQLRSKKSASSFTSASTLMPPALSPAASIESGGSSVPLTTREVLRKPSLVRKWAAQVTAGEPNRRRSRSPLMPNSPMLGSTEERDGEAEQVDTLTEEPMESDEVGLGLGSPAVIRSRAANGHISTIEESDYYEETLGTAGTRDTIETSATLDTMATIETMDRGPQGPEQALAALTAASKTNSPAESPSTPDEKYQSSLLPSKSNKSKSIGSRSIGSRPSSLIFSSSVQYADKEDVDEDRAAGSTPDATSATESPSLDSVPPASALPARVSTKKARSRHSSYASLSRRPEPVEHGKNFVDVADLVPLRQLLDHATTARECQLLLDAILSQLGVPRGEILGGTVARPDDRVVAWLLSGREGPVGDITPVHPKSHSRASSYAGGHGRTSSKNHMPTSRSASSLSGRRRITTELANKNLPALPPPSPLGEEAPVLTPVTTAPVTKASAPATPAPATPEPASVTRTPVTSPPSRKQPIAIEIGATAGEIDAARKADARRARRASAPLMSPSPDLGLNNSPKLSTGLEVPSPRI
ncbi:hypothetical protein Q8F55_008915 [Vanrija albida]|uniref:DNA replication regulator Sld3 C-terminal domain-containing protein n=1 Tax=Vanrija albida TaxID=181172 RepID=A0ABR3PT35_9TREE